VPAGAPLGGRWGTGSSLAAFRAQVNAFVGFFLLDTQLPALLRLDFYLLVLAGFAKKLGIVLGLFPILKSGDDP
jgi:hypothetical protein